MQDRLWLARNSFNSMHITPDKRKKETKNYAGSE